MVASVGKRRRPLWVGTGTVLACILAVMSMDSSAAGLYAKKTAVATSWANFEAKVLRGGRRNTRQKAQPITVHLGHEYDNREIKPHRRMQLTKKNSDGTKSDDEWMTGAPTFSPMHLPSMAPSEQPSRETSNRAEDGPTTGTVGVVRPQIPVLSKSTKDTPPPFQPLRFAAVPVGFDVSLETQSQQDLDEMAKEAKAILEDHLTSSFRDGFSGAEGVLVRSVDLNVKAFLTADKSQRRTLALSQLKRFLQRTRAITLEARGVAGFQVNRNEVDTNAFLEQVNSIIDETLQPQRLMDLFQNSTSGLSEYRVAQVTNTENPDEDEEDKPTMVEIIIALILIVLAAAGLVAYACIFWKKHKKRQKRRKQFGVGHRPPSPYKVAPRGRPHGASVTPSANSTQFMASIPPTLSPNRPSYPARDVASSSSESSYKGLGSESEEDDTDNFAKELRLAATLDRRAWDDFQQRKQQLTEDGDIIEDRGNVSIYNPEEVGSYMSTGIEMEARTARSPYGFSDELPPPPGAVGLTVTGDTVSIQSANSFPYGDENEQTDYLPSSSMYGVGEKSGILQDSQAECQWNSYMTNEGRSRHVSPRETFENEWHMTESAAAEVSKKPAGRGPLSFLYHSEKKEDPEPMPLYYPTENASDPTCGAVRGSPMSHSWSTNPRTTASSSTQNATASAAHGSRENSSSWSSVPRTLSPRHSPPSGSANFGSTRAINEDNASSGEESDSMLTADIVQEVQRLSQFVQTYEKKKEKRTQRREADISYDSTMDTSRDQSHQSSSGRDQHASIQFTKQIRTSSTHSLTPTHSLESERKYGKSMSRSRSKEDEIHGVESIPSSDSSDIQTYESDRRLGISPFAVQRPPGYQNPVTQLSTEYPRLQNNNKASTQSGRFGSPIEKENKPKFGGSSRASALASLRHNEAILDGSSRSTSRPSDEDSSPMPRNDREESTNQASLRNPQTITPRKRSKNRGFNSIISMFEAKEKEPLYPPSEGWQYNY